VAVYHAGMDNFERYRVQQQFMLGQVDVIAATSAFGMGIDKDDVRYVVHYHLSNDLANYLQEIGRAGRDGQQSLAVSLYVPGDESMQLNMIDNSIPSESVIRGVYRDQLTTAEIGQGQFDLVNFYKKRGFEEEQVVVAFADRKASRLLSLNQLVEFVSATKDLRQKLLRAFDDSTAFNDQNESSGASNLHIEELGLSFVSKEPMTAGLLEWHQVLGKMFNLG
jgi:ATP-dependent DNA helicase RecQ